MEKIELSNEQIEDVLNKLPKMQTQATHWHGKNRNGEHQYSYDCRLWISEGGYYSANAAWGISGQGHSISSLREILALRTERDALAATVLRIKHWFDDCGKWPDTTEEMEKLERILESIPQQNLRELRAEAGRAGYLQGHLDAAGDDVGEWSRKHSEFHAKQYADSIRREGK